MLSGDRKHYKLNKDSWLERVGDEIHVHWQRKIPLCCESVEGYNNVHVSWEIPKVILLEMLDD